MCIAVSIHPLDLTRETRPDRLVAAPLRSPRVVAIGETGLGMTIYDQRWPAQQTKSPVNCHLQAARQTALKPVIISYSEARADTLNLLRERVAQRGVCCTAYQDWTMAPRGYG